MSQKIDTFALVGGLDTSSPALATPPESLIFGTNYEPLAEGYGRVDGYERFDGTTAPSAAVFWRLQFETGTEAMASGQTLNGQSSGATGVLLVDPVLTSGAWADNDAAGYLVLVAVSGAFIPGEQLAVGALPTALAAGLANEGEADDEVSATGWLEAAQAFRRAQIAQVPGSGPVRGAAVHLGSVYAWRDNSAGTALLGYRATANSWQALANSSRLTFSAGSGGFAEGDVINGGTSGAQATVIRIVEDTGSWDDGSAAGKVHLIGIAGAFADGEALRVGTDVIATAGTMTDNTFAPGGRVRWIGHNFYGASNRYRLYGATGAANGFELVSGSMVPIETGMVPDTPQRVFEVGNGLGFTFAGGSVQVSQPGEPLSWQVILGAGEIGIGTEITNVVQANETTVAFFGAQKIAILQGHDIDDFVLDTLTEEAGAEPDTAQRIARTVYLDLRGMRSLDATQAFGNFKTGTLSEHFEGFFKGRRKAGNKPVGSLVSRAKSQYRVYYADGTGLSVYMGSKKPQAIPFSFGFVPFSFGQGELNDGEALLVGAEDGYVYRLDSGTSFDGEAISAVAVLPFNHFKSAMQDKRFHKVSVEMKGPPSARIGITVQFNYGEDDQPIDSGGEFTVRGGGGFWDQATWDDFYWSAPISGVAECYVDGQGRNASFTFVSAGGATEAPHVLQAYSVHHSARKVRR